MSGSLLPAGLLQEFMSASAVVYLGTGQSPPSIAGLTPLVGPDGNLVVSPANTDGFYAVAYKDSSGNIIIACEGSLPGLGTAFGRESGLADYSILEQQTPQALSDAVAFGQQVLAAAQALGVSANHVYVTGHSLGGAEAQAISAEFGLSGATFGAPGLPHYVSNGTQPNLVDYVAYGDPVGNYASDDPTERGYAPSSAMDHVGMLQLIGSPQNTYSLSNASALFGLSKQLSKPILAHLVEVAGLLFTVDNHDLSNYASILGLSLPNSFDTLPDSSESLLGIDGLYGASGASDFDASTQLNSGSDDSNYFDISSSSNGSIVTITQNLPLNSETTENSGTVDPGTDVLTIDPSTGDLVNEEFSDSAGGLSFDLIPNSSVSDDDVKFTFTETIQYLCILNAASYTGNITSFQAGDTIDLAGIGTVTGPSLGANKVLMLTESGGSTVTFDLDPTQDFSDESFLIAPDGSGGTEVVAESDSGTIAFTGTGEVLLAVDPGNLSGTISSFQPGDTIDLAGVSATVATLIGDNALVVQTSSGGFALQLDPNQNFSGDEFDTASDGHGGTNITFGIPPVTTVPASETLTVNQESGLSGFSVADPDAIATGKMLTVVLADTNGLLSASQVTGGSVSGVGSTTLTLTGGLDAINAELASLTDVENEAILADGGDGSGEFSDTINVLTSDGRGGDDFHQVAITVETSSAGSGGGTGGSGGGGGGTGGNGGSGGGSGGTGGGSGSGNGGTGGAGGGGSGGSGPIQYQPNNEILAYSYSGGPFTSFLSPPGYEDASPFTGTSVTGEIIIDAASPDEQFGSSRSYIPDRYIGLSDGFTSYTGPNITGIETYGPDTYVAEGYIVLNLAYEVTGWSFSAINGPWDSADSSALNTGGNYELNDTEDNGGFYASDGSAFAGYGYSIGTWSGPVTTTDVTVSPTEGETVQLSSASEYAAAAFLGPVETALINGPGTVEAEDVPYIQDVTVAGGADLLLSHGSITTDTITIDSNGNISGYGTIAGNETVNGSITASGGTLDITGNVSGSGTLTIDAGAALQLEGTVAATNSLVFTGSDEALILGTSADVLAPVSGLGLGDSIALQGQQVTSGLYDPDTDALAVTGSSGAVFDLSLIGTYRQSDFAITNGEAEVTVNGAPALVAPSALTLGVGQSGAIAGVSLSESGNTADETFTVTLSDRHGLLSASGTGVSGSGSTNLTITGSLAEVNADLATLADTDSTTPSDTLTLAASDSFGNAATAVTTVVSVNGAPVIAAPASLSLTQGTSTAIGGVDLSESGNTADETFTVTLFDTHGLLSASGIGVSGSGSTVLTITGSLTQVNADLATLADSEAGTGSDTISLDATDSFGNVANNTIAVAISAAAANTVQGTGNAGSAGGTGRRGTVGQSGTATADVANTSNNAAQAQGGSGGAGGSGTNASTGAGGNAAPGAAGGSANADATTSTANAGTAATASANATGGNGGAAGIPGQGTTNGHGAAGGSGGGSTATASATNTDGAATATASSIGGTGGSGIGAGGGGGAGGVASGTTARAHGTTAATASVTQTGGAGGGGSGGANGDYGASSTLNDAVSGGTDDGTLTLYQEAVGGDGGSSDTSSGGGAGSASSTLDFDDLTQNTTESAVILATVLALGGMPGAGELYHPQGGSAAVSADITGAHTVTTIGTATGGAAPDGGGGTATATVTSTGGDGASDAATATANATGGAGGNIAAGGSGYGYGGGAVSATDAVASGGTATATATGTGGQGGGGAGAGRAGGTGGVASATTATARGVTAATATATQIGGAGGAGTGGASGGSGAASSLVNAVGGTTSGGTLSLTQIAEAGAGGASDTGAGGTGGNAISQLTLNDTASADPSAAIVAMVEGIGGAGGSGASGGNGGSTWDSATIAGAGSVSVTTTAEGGSAGAAGGQGGAAQALTSATGQQVQVVSVADAGAGTTAGIAKAVAGGTGGSGSATAQSQTSLLPGSLLVGVSGDAVAPVDGGSTAASQSTIDATQVWGSGYSAAANIEGLPAASAVTPLLAANANTQSALGGPGAVLAFGELAGGHAASGGSQTSTASVSLTLNLLHLAASPDLFLAFDDPAASASGVSAIEVSVLADGTSLLSENFASAAAAKSWFSDHPIDLGPLASGMLAAQSTLTLTASLSVTTAQAGGFQTQFLIGEAAANSQYALM